MREAAPVRRGRAVLDAPGKLNLTLEVLRRRADGYHELETLLQSVDLADRVEIEVEPGDGLHVVTSDSRLPTGVENLAGRAALAVLEELGTVARVRIAIDKRIPSGAGMGGGSADAAATLVGLDRLLGERLGAHGRWRLAAALGSDVPFFLVGGTCFAWGRGERLLRLPPLARASGVGPFVLVFADRSVESRWAYNSLQQVGLTPYGGYTRMLAADIRRGVVEVDGAYWRNDLEAAVVAEHDQLRVHRQHLIQAGAHTALMTGSGSVVFGVAQHLQNADRIASVLRQAKLSVHVARPINMGVVLRGVS